MVEATLAGAALDSLVGMYSEADGQWANGVTPNGNEFFPLFPSGETAEPWRKHWPGYVVRPIQRTDLIGEDGFLADINEEDMWVALLAKPDVLMMHHPIALEVALVARSPS